MATKWDWSKKILIDKWGERGAVWPHQSYFLREAAGERHQPGGEAGITSARGETFCEEGGRSGKGQGTGMF